MKKSKDDINEEKEIQASYGNVEKRDFNNDDGEYKLNVIADYYGGIDITYLNKKDPNYEYHWLNSDQKNLSIKTSNVLVDRGGWQLCPRKHLVEKLKIAETEVSADGLLRRGDLVLAFMPKDLYAKKQDFKKKKANERMSAIERRLKEGENTEHIHHSMKGIQTAKQLGLK